MVIDEVCFVIEPFWVESLCSSFHPPLFFLRKALILIHMCKSLFKGPTLFINYLVLGAYRSSLFLL